MSSLKLILPVWMISESIFEPETHLMQVRLQVKVIINLYLIELSNVMWP